MTDTSPQRPAPAAGPSFFDQLVPHAQTIAYVLIGAGVAMAAVPVYSAVRNGWEYLPLLVWSTFLALLLVFTGVLYLASRGPGMTVAEADALRIVALVLGGAGGFATALFGLALPIFQYREELRGGLQAWRDNRWPLTWSALAFVGGLVLMFLGFMQARAFERTQPALRRLAHGYNAVLGALLLLCVLGLVNVLPYSPVWPLSLLGKPLDMTRTGDFTLKPATVSMLASLDKPLRIYVLLTDRDTLDQETATLLDQARATNGLISWETVSRDLNPDKWRELEQTYKVPGGGMLLVYGNKPDEETEHIKLADLRTSRMRMDGSTDTTFQGEYALLSAVTSLYEGKSRPVVYFTQGNGELDFRGTPDRASSMGLFIEELSKSNYELRPLPFGPKAAEEDFKGVPDDAEVVVIAGPRRPLSQPALDALRKYLSTPRGAKKKKGKLIALLDVVIDTEAKKMVHTGVEGLLREYNVDVGDNYVFANNSQFNDPRRVVALANPMSKSPIGPAFTTRRQIVPFVFYQARTVTPGGGGPGATRAEVDPLLIVPDSEECWAETDLTATLPEIIRRIKAKGGRVEIADQIVGVTVTEPRESAALPMGHPTSDQTPRMVVIGNAGWVADDSEPKLRKTNAALIGSSISWLRERPDIGEPPTKEERKTYTLTVNDAASERRLEWLPGGLMLLGIVTLGGGVWVVRRR
jgi:hypothetical protein